MSPKQVGFELISIIDKLAQKKINHWYIREFWNRFFLSHANNTMSLMTDIEIKEVLDEAYNLLSPIYETKQSGKLLKEGIKLGSPRPALTPEIKKLLELELDNVLR